MKKRRWKRSIAVGMTATMLLTMAGCGKKEEKQTTTNENSNEMVYHGEELEIEGIFGDISDFYVRNDRIYFDTYEWMPADSGEDTEDLPEKEGSETGEQTGEEEGTPEEQTSEAEDTPEEQTSEAESPSEEQTEEEGADSEDPTEEEDTEYYEEGTSIQRMYSVNLDGSDLKEIPFPELEQDQWISYLSVGEDESLSFILSSYDAKTEKSEYILKKLDAQGNELLDKDLTSVLGLNDNNYISKMLVDGKGRFLIAMDQEIHILSEDGELDKTVKAPSSYGYMEGMALTKDGQIICGSSGEENAEVQILDVDAGKWGDTIKLNIRYFQSSDSLMDGAEYDFYYYDDSGIYGYDMEAGASTKLLDYVASDLGSDSTWGIKPIGKDKMLGTEYSTNGTRFVLYSKVDPSTIVDKTVITVGSLYGDYEIKNAAIEFNKKSDKYRIEIKDYSSEEDPLTKMNADIVAGNIPDIIDLNSLPIGQYVSKGLLEDLTPYYEADAEINAEDMLDSVLETIQMDDKIYYISPSFGISTMIARRSDVGEKMGWNFDDMKALVAEKGDDVQLFYYNWKSSIMYSFLTLGLNQFVDWQTGECSFDNQDFKEILELCNQGVDDDVMPEEDDPSMPTMIREGKVLFVDGWMSPEEVQLYEKMYEGDITYIGYPCEDKQGSYFNFYSRLGMYSGSANKEAAWEFLRTFMTKEYQGKTMDHFNMPTRKDCFDMVMREKTTTESYTDEFGNEITPMQSTYGYDDLEVEIKPLSKEEADMYIELVNNTRKSDAYDQNIMDIVTEETQAYFAGDKSVDETAEIIQSRVKTYVNENR